MSVCGLEECNYGCQYGDSRTAPCYTPKHGGKRKGSGAKPKYGEPTKVIRVPISLIPKIEQMLKTTHLHNK